MARYFYVNGDTNDADYVSQETEIKGIYEEHYDKIVRMAKVIMENRTKELPNRRIVNNHNYPNSEYAFKDKHEMYPMFSAEDWELFDGIVPCGEYGIHTIVALEVREVNTVLKL